MNNISLNTNDLMDIIEEYEVDKTEASPCPLRAFCIYIMDKYQPERLSEKTANGETAFKESMEVYKDCLSIPLPKEMKKLFCGCDSLNTTNK